MARHEIVVYKDDLDGSEEGVKVVKFGIDGINYEIDLGPANHAKLRELLAPYVAVATKVDRAATGRRPTRVTSVRRTGALAEQKEFNSRVRKWAVANGHQVKERGRVPEKIITAYTKSGGK